MSWFRFVLLIASTSGLLVSVSAYKSTPGLYVSNDLDCYTFMYKIDDNLFRLEKTTLKKLDNGKKKLELTGALSYMDKMDNKHIVEYWHDGKKYDQKEVEKLPKELEDFLKKYD